MKKVLILFFVFIFLGTAFRVNAIPNPAAVFCVEQGYEIISGYCVLSDEVACEQWEFFRGECGKEFRKEMACKEAGQQIKTGQCCGGLIAILDTAPDTYGKCVQRVGGWAICAACGDGVCGVGENICNCPLDCKKEEPETKFIYYILGVIDLAVLGAAALLFTKRHRKNKNNNNY